MENSRKCSRGIRCVLSAWPGFQKPLWDANVREVIVSLILDQGIIPSVPDICQSHFCTGDVLYVTKTSENLPDQHSLQRDLMSARDVLRILCLNILVENWTIVTSIALARKVKAFSRVLRERSHESLQCLPKVRGCSASCVSRQGQVGVAVCSTGLRVLRIVGADRIWQADDLFPGQMVRLVPDAKRLIGHLRIHISIDWNAVRETRL